MVNIISFLFHVLFFFTPLLLWPKLSEVFEFPKMLFVYGMTILITTAWIVSWVKQKKITIRRTPFDIPILLFLLVQILSTYFSIDQHTSLWGYYSRFHGGLASTISYILLYYAFTSNVKGRTLDIINTILLSTALISVYAILEHFGIDKNVWVQDVQSRVFSTLGQPNWLSAYLVAVLPLPIYLFIGRRKAKDGSVGTLSGLQPIFYILLSILIFTAIIFTKSQSGIAATIIVLLLILTHLSLQYKKLPHLIALITISIISTFLLKPHYITKSLTSLNKINPFYSTTQTIAEQDLETRGNSGSDSMAIRRVVWQGAMDLGKKHPILGTGPETFAYSYYWQRPAAHNLLSEWDFLYNKAHNEYLNFFATTGYLGLTSYLLLIIWITTWWVKNRSNRHSGKQIFARIQNQIPESSQTRPQNDEQAMITPLFIGWLSILITNFFGFSVVAVALLFFLFPALAISLQKSSKGSEPSAVRSDSEGWFGTFVSILTIIFSLYLLISLSNTFRADLLYNQSKFQPNIELLQKAVILQPNQPLFLAKLAEQEAKTAATIFIQLSSLPEEAKNAQKQLEKQSQEHVAQALDMNQYNINLLKSKARVEIYLSNINQWYSQQALNTLLQASLLAPTDSKLLFNIGIIYSNLNKPEQATESFKKAVELKPNYQQAISKLQP